MIFSFWISSLALAMSVRWRSGEPTPAREDAQDFFDYLDGWSKEVQGLWAATHPKLFDDRLDLLSRERGIKFIDSGLSRAVFQLPGGLVLKVKYKPNDRQRQNTNEVMVWERSSEEVKKNLVPVIARHRSNQWILMEEADTEASDKLPWSEIYAFQCKMDALGFTDLSEFNLGLHQGDLKILDYGYKSPLFPKEQRKLPVYGSSTSASKNEWVATTR